MIFNFSKQNQLTSRIKLENENLEIVKEAKILGTTITDDLKWDTNTKNIVKKANARMQLLSKLAKFKPSMEDLKVIYILFIRSLLEQSCVVWNTSITKEDRINLERVQKSAVKIILNKTDVNYRKALMELDLKSLEERRNELCLRFATKCTNNDETKQLFPKATKMHHMKLRKSLQYKENRTKTTRYQRSSIPMMQKMLNEEWNLNLSYKK